MIDLLRAVGNVRLRFTWEGGPYIDVHEVGWTAAEVINVWDGDKGEPGIPVTQAAFAEAVDRWIDTYREDLTPLQSRAALEHDVIANWRLTATRNTRGGRLRSERA